MKHKIKSVRISLAFPGYYQAGNKNRNIKKISKKWFTQPNLNAICLQEHNMPPVAALFLLPAESDRQFPFLEIREGKLFLSWSTRDEYQDNEIQDSQSPRSSAAASSAAGPPSSSRWDRSRQNPVWECGSDIQT